MIDVIEFWMYVCKEDAVPISNEAPATSFKWSSTEKPKEAEVASVESYNSQVKRVINYFRYFYLNLTYKMSWLLCEVLFLLNVQRFK